MPLFPNPFYSKDELAHYGDFEDSSLQNLLNRIEILRAAEFINDARFRSPLDPFCFSQNYLKILSSESSWRRRLEECHNLRLNLQSHGHHYLDWFLANYSTAQLSRQSPDNSTLCTAEDAFNDLCHPLTNSRSDVCNTTNARSLENRFLCASPKMENSANLSGSISKFYSTPSQTNPHKRVCVNRCEDNSLSDSEISKIRPEECSSSSAIESEDNHKIETETTRMLNSPPHPLNAYNFFFSDERMRILNDAMPGDKKSELNIDYHRHSDDSYMKTTLNQYLKQRLLKKSKKRVHRKSHGKISFKDLASLVANRWKTISPEKLSYYKKLAELDKINYDLALSKCKRQRLIKGKRI